MKTSKHDYVLTLKKDNLIMEATMPYDTSVDELIDIFVGMLVTSGWSQSTIEDALVEKYSTLNE